MVLKIDYRIMIRKSNKGPKQWYLIEYHFLPCLFTCKSKEESKKREDYIIFRVLFYRS